MRVCVCRGGALALPPLLLIGHVIGLFHHLDMKRLGRKVCRELSVNIGDLESCVVLEPAPPKKKLLKYSIENLYGNI